MLKKIVNNLSTAPKETSQLIRELYVKPKEELGHNQMPTFQIYKDGIYQQSDLLFLPEDNSQESKEEKLFWISVDQTKVKAVERKLFNNISKAFHDTDDKTNYIIIDVVKPSKISKVKKGLYYKYYDKDKYGLNVPENESEFEYTQVDIFLNAKWVKWKAKEKKLVLPKLQMKSGYRYALVCVDLHSKKCDAEPIRNKTSESIINGYKNIYARKILKIPKMMYVDAGTEFKGEVADFFIKLGMKVRPAEVQRHRQQALVERKNQLIGQIIAHLQGEKELDTKAVNTEWVKILPSIIKEINSNLPKPLMTQPYNFPYSDKTNEGLLEKGSLVRVALDHPINIHNEKTLMGKFRDSDIRWSTQKYPIKEVLLKPSEPPLYLTSHDNALHTRQQLLFV